MTSSDEEQSLLRCSIHFRKRQKSLAQPIMGGWWWVIQTNESLLLFLTIASTWFHWAPLVAIFLPLNSLISSLTWFWQVLAVAVKCVWLHWRCARPNTEQSRHLYNHSHKQLSLSDECQTVKQFLQLKTQSLRAVQTSVLFSILGCVYPQCRGAQWSSV
jgi:hypothetical protein